MVRTYVSAIFVRFGADTMFRFRASTQEPRRQRTGARGRNIDNQSFAVVFALETRRLHCRCAPSRESSLLSIRRSSHLSPRECVGARVCVYTGVYTGVCKGVCVYTGVCVFERVCRGMSKNTASPERRLTPVRAHTYTYVFRSNFGPRVSATASVARPRSLIRPQPRPLDLGRPPCSTNPTSGRLSWNRGTGSSCCCASCARLAIRGTPLRFTWRCTASSSPKKE